MFSTPHKFFLRLSNEILLHMVHIWMVNLRLSKTLPYQLLSLLFSNQVNPLVY